MDNTIWVRCPVESRPSCCFWGIRAVRCLGILGFDNIHLPQCTARSEKLRSQVTMTVLDRLAVNPVSRRCYTHLIMAEGRSRIWIWLLVGGGLFALFVVAVFTLVFLSFGGQNEESFSGFGSKIAVVELDGVIFSPKQIVPQLKKFADDDSVKAIIIHVNSPGGGVAASEEIYREVKRIRDEKKKRIVASIETVGASGAYYVASATNKIYADKGSVVGSIGVIAEWVNYGELLKWAKLNAITLKAGEFKDTGNPTREMTPAEREYMQGLIDRKSVV